MDDKHASLPRAYEHLDSRTGKTDAQSLSAVDPGHQHVEMGAKGDDDVEAAETA
jgi:hypothetical protein